MDPDLKQTVSLSARDRTQRRAAIPAIAAHTPPPINVWWPGNGPRVVVRSILPQDADAYRAFVRSLSQGSRYRRFLSGLYELSPAMVERLTHIDYRDHLALVAETFAADGPTLIGEARYIRAGDDPRRAEFALAIADAWQGNGLGNLLLRSLLRRAAAAGVRHLYGDVLHENRAMLRLAQRTGFAGAPHPEDDRLVRVVIDPTAVAPRSRDVPVLRPRYAPPSAARPRRRGSAAALAPARLPPAARAESDLETA